MKQPVIASVIEFSSKLIMVNTNNILAAFAITFLASLSLSSAYAKHNLDIPNTFEKHFDHELRPLREKREKEAEVFHLKNNNPLELEEESLEPKSIYERRTLGEEAKDVKNSKEQEKLNIEPKTNNNIVEEEEDAQVIIEIYYLFTVRMK